MNDIQKRILLFLFMCIPVRLLITYLLYINKYTNLIKIILLLIGIGFIKTFKNSERKKGFFGGHIWWNDLRPFHGFNYILASYMTHNNMKNAYKVILFDTILGLGKYVRYNSLHFSYLT